MSSTVDSSTQNISDYENNTAAPIERQPEPEALTIYIQFAAILSLVVVTVTGNLLLLAIAHARLRHLWCNFIDQFTSAQFSLCDAKHASLTTALW